MKRFNSIKKNEEFKFIYNNGVSYANKYLVMYLVKNEDSKSRIGVSVSKKVGNSVVRHRLVRLLRESFRLNEEKFLFNADLVVVVRVNAKDAGYKEINSSFLHLCRLHKLMVKEMV